MDRTQWKAEQRKMWWRKHYLLTVALYGFAIAAFVLMMIMEAAK